MRTFVEKTDADEVNEWLKKRGSPPLEKNFIPKYGMIEPGIAVGFLCLTDSAVSFLELFITNPDALSAQRDKALNRIIRWGINLSTAMGFKRCLFVSAEESLVKRGIEYGFEVMPVTMGVKTL